MQSEEKLRMQKLKQLKEITRGSWLCCLKGKKTVGVKWIYKTKLNEKGEVEKFKARLFSG